MDLDTEARLIAGLVEHPDRSATIILSSHRLAAFPLADQIIVLDQGYIVEQGTHETLMMAGGLYARIFQAQRATYANGHEDMR